MARKRKPLCIDLYCGLGGWAEGFLREGYDVVGFDIEKHDYGTGVYPGQLVLQDCLTLTGKQFASADAIVASPPCTEPSYRAMPWGRAKWLNRKGPPHMFIRLFEVCFRLQREIFAYCGRYVPLVVENVYGAQRWVGPAANHFGSFYLWGDVPARLPLRTAPMTNPREHVKVPGQDWNRFRKDGVVSQHWKIQGLKMRATGHYTKPGSGSNWFDMGAAAYGSNSLRRKQASAEIAMIPFPLSVFIAQYLKPVAQ